MLMTHAHQPLSVPTGPYSSTYFSPATLASSFHIELPLPSQASTLATVSVCGCGSSSTNSAAQIRTPRQSVSSPPMDSTPSPSRSIASQKARDAKVRSCIACYKRKVRCDRRSPCSKCVRSHTDCVYPTKPESSITLGEDQIASRMQKLEGVVADLRNRLPQRRTRRLSQPHSQLLMTEDEDVNYLHNAFWKNINVQVSDILMAVYYMSLTEVSSRKLLTY